MNKKPQIFIIMMLVLMLSCNIIPVVNADGETYENKYGKLEIYPTTSNELIRQKQFYNITWYYPENNLDIAFRFNNSLTYGKIYYWNGSNYNKINCNHVEYNNKHYYVLNNIRFNQNEMKHGYWEYDTPINSSGKWDMFIKLTSDTWQSAINSNRYVHLDPWWNSAWDYSKCSTICNSVTDYQVKLTVGKTSGGDVNCSGNCQDDFDDIRFTKGDNTTELHYWMENYTSGVQATFWVNISDATTVCMYYGNNAVSTTSNGVNTFIYFDDWTSDNTGDWWSFRETAGGGDDTANNVYNITGGIGYNNRLRYRHTMYEWTTYSTGASFRVGFCSNEWDATGEYPDNWIGALTSSDTSDGSTAIIQSWNCYRDVNGATGGTTFVDTDPFSSSAYYIRDSTLISTDFTSTHYKDDGTLMSTSSITTAEHIPDATDLDNLIIFTYVDGATSYFQHNSGDGELTVGGYRLDSKNVFSIDWMFLGEYASTEPTFCAWSDEFISIVCPEFTFTDITPTHGSTTVSYLITNLSVTINSSTGDIFNYTIECSNGNTTFANNVGNGTYNLPVCCLEQEILYFWYVNVTHNVTCGWTNVTYNFTTKLSDCLCTDELNVIIDEFRILNKNLEGNNVLELEANQWSMLLALGIFVFLFAVGYNSEKRSGGLFLLIAGFTLFYIEALATLNGWLSPVFVLPFLSPLAIYIVVIGAKKFAYGANLKTDTKQK